MTAIDFIQFQHYNKKLKVPHMVGFDFEITLLEKEKCWLPCFCPFSVLRIPFPCETAGFVVKDIKNLNLIYYFSHYRSRSPETSYLSTSGRRSPGRSGYSLDIDTTAKSYDADIL